MLTRQTLAVDGHVRRQTAAQSARAVLAVGVTLPIRHARVVQARRRLQLRLGSRDGDDDREQSARPIEHCYRMLLLCKLLAHCILVPIAVQSLFAATVVFVQPYTVAAP